jgi:surface antigen
MRKWGTKVWLLGSGLLFSSPLMLTTAEANQFDLQDRTAPNPGAFIHAHPIGTHTSLASGVKVSQAMQLSGYWGKRGATRSYGISCVPYARQVSGIMVAGNAWQWWYNASGLYARGDRPEAGSVLNFRPNGRMRLGHVAVVSRVINAREVVVNHANWPSGGRGGVVARDVSVVDVSEANNWSAVRVEMDRNGTFGSVYPTYGFIYNRPDAGIVNASIARPASQPDINPAPSDLRPAAERPWRTVEEVAESRSAPARPIDLRVGSEATRAAH